MTDPAAPARPAAPRWADLHKRVLSAVIMVAIAGIDIWLGGAWFAALVIAITAGSLWELARMTAPTRPRQALALGALGGASLLFVFLTRVEVAAMLLLLPALVFATTDRRDRRLAALWAAAAVVAGYGLVTLREVSGTAAILWLIGVVVASDVLGYFVGRMVGGPKFWPAISPKKTWSGTAAGWVGAAGVGAGFWAMGLAGPMVIVLSPVVALAGQMGDILESLIKRRAGVKDSSSLIPGHGGLMDRFDALTGAALVVILLGLALQLPLPAPHPFDDPPAARGAP